jgi:hypothetical protein
MKDVDGDRRFIVDEAIQHKLGGKEEIQLYEELSLALELMDDNTFKVVGQGIDANTVQFGISTPYPHGLPEKVGQMFFNVSTDYDVRVKETSQCVYNTERYFEVNLKKVW